MAELNRDLSPTEKSLVIMFDKYLRELREISGETDTDTMKQALEYFLEIRTSRHERIYRVFLPNGTVAGFLILGTSPNTHPDADYFIQEFYISKEYRRQGIGSEFMKEFISKHDGRYCMFVIDKNMPARKFWGKVFQSSGYIPVDLRDVGCTPAGCSQYGFYPMGVDKYGREKEG